jgi:hypothetical protein
MLPINDARFAALRGLGFTGATNDMLLAYLQDGGATSGSLNDAWLEWLAIVFPTGTGQKNDSWYGYLGSLGYTGSLNDREQQYWNALIP